MKKKKHAKNKKTMIVSEVLSLSSERRTFSTAFSSGGFLAASIRASDALFGTPIAKPIKPTFCTA